MKYPLNVPILKTENYSQDFVIFLTIILLLFLIIIIFLVFKEIKSSIYLYNKSCTISKIDLV